MNLMNMNRFIPTVSIRRSASLIVAAVVAAESLLTVSAFAQQGAPRSTHSTMTAICAAEGLTRFTRLAP